MLTGFCLAVISTLTFHQAMWSLLFLADLMGPPFPLTTNRFGVPLLVSICIWRGLWGAAYGAASSWHLKSAWLSGLLFGILVGTWEWVSAFLRSGEWALTQTKWLYLMQALLVNGFWGTWTWHYAGRPVRANAPDQERTLLTLPVRDAINHGFSELLYHSIAVSGRKGGGRKCQAMNSMTREATASRDWR